MGKVPLDFCNLAIQAGSMISQKDAQQDMPSSLASAECQALDGCHSTHVLYGPASLSFLPLVGPCSYKPVLLKTNKN